MKHNIILEVQKLYSEGFFFSFRRFFFSLLEASHNGDDLRRVTFFFLTLKRITSLRAKPVVFTKKKQSILKPYTHKQQEHLHIYVTIIINEKKSRGQMEGERRRGRKIQLYFNLKLINVIKLREGQSRSERRFGGCKNAAFAFWKRNAWNRGNCQMSKSAGN